MEPRGLSSRLTMLLYPLTRRSPDHALDGDKECRWRLPDGTWGLNGRKLQELPLYGAEQVSSWNADDLIVLVEGEKARDALDRTDFFNVLGTVTGAGVSLNCSIYYTLRDELRRTPCLQTSQNSTSTHSGE